MKKLIPNRLVSNRKSLPWLTKAARKCLQTRHAAKKFDSPEKFRLLRNKAVAKLREEKRTFFQSLSKKTVSLKAFWKVYNMITKDSQSIPSSITNGQQHLPIRLPCSTITLLLVFLQGHPPSTCRQTPQMTTCQMCPVLLLM